MSDAWTSILTGLLIVFVGLLYYVYDGYLRLLRFVVRVDRRPVGQPETVPGEPPSIAVVVTVHDEAHQIVERVKDILSQDYPQRLREVVIASDGSTDDLAAVIVAHFGDDVRLVASDHRVGKSSIQNQAVEAIGSSIVLFTDADTRFAPGFLRGIVAPFANDAVGASQAHLLFVPPDASSPMASQARYWRAELEIRQMEAHLGILAVTSGCCVAVRRALWRPLDPAYGDDCMIPLDVIGQSKLVAYAEAAVAYEPEDDEFENVIANRARMTMRNWQGTWSRPKLLNPFAHPGHAFALWSHKVLRWLSPVWLLGLSAVAVALPFASAHPFAFLPGAAVVVLFALAAIGAVAGARSRRVPVCAEAYAFMLANLGFLGGLIKAARGQRIHAYR